MFILDTNVISELRAGKPQQSPKVREWAAAQSPSRLFLSAVTILELEQGVLALERRSPPQGSAIRAWLSNVSQAFAGRILPFNERTAVLCASFHVPNKRAERDCMIAASAAEHGFALVTRNVEDFSALGLVVVNPWH